MGLEGLTDIEILHGTFSIIYTVISCFIGVKIGLKFVKFKQKELLSFGITWIVLGSSWWGSAFSFINYLIMDVAFNLFLLLFLSGVFFPLTVIFWIYTFSLLLYPENKNKIVLIFTAITFVYEIVYLTLLFIDPYLLATENGVINFQYNLFGQAFQGFMYLVAIISGLLFTKKSLESVDLKIKWKGRFILIAIITFTIAAVLQIALPTFIPAIIIVYILLVLSVIEFYLGFLLPEGIANRLVRE